MVENLNELWILVRKVEKQVFEVNAFLKNAKPNYEKLWDGYVGRLEVLEKQKEANGKHDVASDAKMEFHREEHVKMESLIFNKLEEMKTENYAQFNELKSDRQRDKDKSRQVFMAFLTGIIGLSSAIVILLLK